MKDKELSVLTNVYTTGNVSYPVVFIIGAEFNINYQAHKFVQVNCMYHSKEEC